MKKIILFLFLSIIIINPVKAEIIQLDYSEKLERLCSYYYVNPDFVLSESNLPFIKELYKDMFSYYQEHYSSEYPYYYSSLRMTDKNNCNNSSWSGKPGDIYLNFYAFDHIPNYSNKADYNISIRSIYRFSSNTYESPMVIGDSSLPLFAVNLQVTTYPNPATYKSIYYPLNFFTSNFTMTNDTDYDYSIIGVKNFTVHKNDLLEPIYSPNNSFGETMISVNLQNYKYVILSLKDYNQTKAFKSSMFVKGMVGITPVYNFGTSEKDMITDRCNSNYEDFTPYDLYITSNDLKNKSVYYVKSCNNLGEFKFDSSVFDITYITEENQNNPVINVAGNSYNVIPFDNLTNSSNKNEDNNYIPGESSSASNGLSSIVDNLSSTLDGVWSIFTGFFSFVTRIFSVLPPEIRAVTILTFTTGCILGLIKILKG